jgi:hypothetical protein
MIIFGIDQGMMGDAGFAIVDVDAHVVLHTQVETYAVDRMNNLAERTRRIPIVDVRWRGTRFGKVIQELSDDWHPDIVVTELIRTYHQGKRDPVTVASLSIAYTTICLVIRKPIPIVSINVSTWQSLILPKGYTNDTKAYSIARVEQCYGLTLPEHAADAVNMCDAYPLVIGVPKLVKNKNCVRILT